MEKFRDLGVSGASGQLAPGPVEKEYKNRLGPAYLCTLHLSTPPEGLVFSLITQAV